MLGLVIFAAVCLAVAGIGGLVTARSVPTWYARLHKPPWTPPAWVFGPVWTALYLMMACAAWLVWRRAGAAVPLILFFVQLALNGAWTPIFFGLKLPGPAFGVIVALWWAILATTIAFWRATPLAGALMLPYLAWVTFAGALNFAIWRMNG
jgi:tryptophan-rich sensory protein